MSKAIGLRFVPYDKKKHQLSHFRGAPIIPMSMVEDFGDEVFFLGMIHLPEIAKLDTDGKLPHEGILYFFMDDSKGDRHLHPIVCYVKEEPECEIDDFNEGFVEAYPDIDKPLGVEFVEVEEDDDGCKLLGVPADWNYESGPKDELLLSISHFDEELNLLPQLDGYTYIFFGPEGPKRFSGAYAFYEYS